MNFAREIFQKLFIAGHWTIAYRFASDNIIPINPENGIVYNIIEPTKDYWFADPFIISKDSNIYLFCEIYDKKKDKGGIGLSILDNGIFGTPKMILEENYHLSYPCVFKYKNNYFMIPETSENKTIELFVSHNFPYNWKREKVLLEKKYCVDSTVFEFENNYYIITYEYYHKEIYLNVYLLDMETQTIRLKSQKMFPENNGRPAGNIFIYDGKTIRPSQNQIKKYGENVIFNEIINFDCNNYTELKLGNFSSKNVKIFDYPKIHRVHTYNRIGQIEVIDVRTEKLDLFLVFKKLRKKSISIKRSKYEGKL